METFIEYRGIKLTHKPYRGEQFTQSGQGYTPGVWEMQFPQAPFFEARVEEFEIPYTSDVKTCYKCHGSGTIQCTRCMGRGYTERTVHKDGKSETERDTCHRLVHIILHSSITIRRL